MPDDEPRMKIRVTENGPYRVRGGAPLVRTAIIETEDGEPIAWEADEPLASGPTYSLCRCGGSSNKPFCDDTHLTNGFDGTEVADRAPRADRVEVFEGDDLEMTDDESLCVHAGFCTTLRTHAWELVGRSDDPDLRAQLLGMIAHCPSGRLGVRPSADADEVEPDLPRSIAVVRDGPLWVRGGVEVTGADGHTYEIRNRVTLCRCGRSENKPFCDGSHAEFGFREPVSPGADDGADADPDADPEG